MLCWRRESLSHLDLTTHTNNMSVRGVRLSTFNLLQRISNYAFSNTFCGCSRVRTSVCYHRHGCNVLHRTTQMVSPPRTPYTHPYFCVRRWNRTTVVVWLQPTAKPLSYSHMLNLGRVLVIELQVDSQRPSLLDNSYTTLVQLSTGVIYQSLQ